MTDKKIKLLQHAVARSGSLVIDHIGSGVGIMLYSPSHRIGAGIHVLAPRSSGIAPRNLIMYANTAVPFIIKELQAKGATPPFSVAIAGGAGLLNSETSINSGRKVVDAVRDALGRANLTIKIDKTGGTKIRSIILDIDAGRIKIT